MIAPQLNSAVVEHIKDYGYIGLEIMPNLGYSDTTTPFIIYTEGDIMPSRERPFIKFSNVNYYIYSNSVEQVADLAYHIERFLAVERDPSSVNAKITMLNPKYRILGLSLVGGGTTAPLERSGFTSKSLIFQVMYVYANQTE